MKRTLFLFSALAALLGTQSAFAQDDDNQIVVTATRTNSAPDRVAAAMSVITAQDLERRQSAFVVDALGAAPGLAIAQNGAFGGQASVRIRGALSEQTLVLLDGVVVNDPSSPGGGFNIGLMDTADVERIEVLRGPQSTLWGSNAIGGVVNIVTRRPQDGFSARAFAEGGSFGTLRGGVGVAHGGERFDVRLGASAIASDGISKAEEDDGNPETDDFESVTLDGRAGFDITDALRLEAFGRYSKSDNSYDSFGFVTRVEDGPELERTTESSYGLVGRYDAFGGRFRNLVTLSRMDIERENFTAGVFGFGADGARDTIRYQGDVRASDAIDVSFGAEREEVSVEGAGENTTDSLFLLAEARPSESLTLSGGVRRDDHEVFGDVTTGRLGLRWAPSEAFGMRASWGQGFKAPTLFQLTFFFPPATGPNLDLQPEQAEGWDAAVFTTLGPFHAEVGYFSIETENLIQFSFSNRYENVAEAKSEGVEVEARFDISPELSINAHYTYTDATDETTGLPLLRVPEHAAFAELNWDATDAFGLTLTARCEGDEAEFPTPANPEGINEAWTRVDLAGRYRLNDRIELYARVENLADEDYQDTFGYGTPGRSVYGGVRLRIE